MKQAGEDWEGLYHQLVEFCPDPIITAVDGKITAVNRAGTKLLGASDPDQLVGRSLANLVLPAYRNNLAECFQKTFDSTSLAPVEEEWLQIDGTVIDVQVTSISIAIRGHAAVQFIVHDITHAKHVEESLRESEARHRRLMELYLDQIGVEAARTAELQAALGRAREVDKLKSQLLSIVSHELRTPLTAIRGQTSTLLDYADQMTSDEQVEALHIVDKEAARLDELIGHLLDASRIESGTLRVEPVATNLRPILIEVVESIAAQAPKHALVAQVPPVLPLAQADPRRVRQVIGNLLDNAIKFAPSGTTVTLTATTNGQTVVISVHDEGPGIAPEHLPRIFDRFYHAPSSGVRVGGVGLGLAICKGLVEAMGGRISVNSQIGQGTTFSFSLPLTTGVAEHE